MSLRINGSEPQDVRVNGNSVQEVRRNGSRVWPEDHNLVTGQSKVSNTGWERTDDIVNSGNLTSSWHTQIIPSSERSGKLSYVVRADFRIEDESGTNAYMAMRTFYATDATPFDDLELTNVIKHGYYSTDGGGFTFTVSEGRVIIGFEYRFYHYKPTSAGGTGYDKYEMRGDIYVYTAKVVGVQRPYRMVDGFQTSSSDSAEQTSSNEPLNNLPVYGNNPGGDKFLQGIYINLDVDASITWNIDLTNYHKSGTITY